ncbi:MAG: SRPBCC family protein [Pseudomonadota bacterium]
MNRRHFVTSFIAVALLPACTTSQESPMENQTAHIAPGTNRDFSFTVSTSNPEGVWDFWTTPSTWGQWDRGLKSASMDGEMALGSVGQIIPLSGPSSSFEVVSFEPKNSYAFETRLPGAVLRVARSFNADRTEFTHRVTFSGIAAGAFARMFGPGFRQALPPTMRQLKALSEQG